MKLGYIGLTMGRTLARSLVDRLHLTVLNLNAANVARFVALGAKAATAAKIGRDCEMVFLRRPRSSNVRKVLFGPEGLVGESSQTQASPRNSPRAACASSTRPSPLSRFRCARERQW